MKKPHKTLPLNPADSPEHAAHRERMRIHQQRVRAYLRDLKHATDDN
jgi:hypothetical protein